jgi:alkylation response protein AidB-like acyl-CoA dehydrogenase
MTGPAADTDDFRRSVRSFVKQALPPEMAERVRRSAHPARADVSAWMRILYAKGWAAVGWPEEYGGPGWDGMQRIVFEEECLAADAPAQHFANIHSVGPVIYTFGTAEQKQRFLRPLLAGDHIWCQGFSEPNAGSDLASLTTRAVRDGDHFVVNGQKTWTSDAADADWMFALVRTSAEGKPQAGISFVLIDMRSPGIEVRPIEMIDGGHAVNEVFLSDVRVPVANLVGDEGQGWDIAKFLLRNERAFSAEVPFTKRDFARLLRVARVSPAPGQPPAWDDPLFRARVVDLYCDLVSLEYSMLRVLFSEDAESPQVAGILKVPGSELRQRVSELMLEALGPYGTVRYSENDGGKLPGPPHARGVAATYLYRRAATVYGGSSEIQRTIIAKTILGL